jgi:hypothetical protein
MKSNTNWERLYKIAVVQTDSWHLSKAITEAEKAIEDRLNECPPPMMEVAEVQAIGRTLLALCMLKSQNRLSKPSQPSNGHYPPAEHQEQQGTGAS